MIGVLAGMTAVVASIGVAEALAGCWLVASFARRRPAPPVARPPVTALKPLHGDEPLLEDALTTLCQQDYPRWQIVFGVQNAADPAIAVVSRLQMRFSDLDITLVVDSALHGRNRKVGNLINMMPAARHDLLVVADSDVHARPDYLDSLVRALQQPGVGLVTTLYAGLPANGKAPKPSIDAPTPAIGAHATAHGTGSIPARLGATQITHGFLPGALLARAFGREDCLGATMCLRRSDLARIGGFPALVDHLADDNVLGRRIAALGLQVALADTVPLTTVPEASLRALFRHELRWARTIRALEPIGFAASILQYPLAWALLTVLLSGGALWAICVFFAAWLLRAIAAVEVDRALAPLWNRKRRSNKARSSEVEPTPDGNRLPSQSEPAGFDLKRAGSNKAALAFSCPAWLLPLRDVLSVVVMVASYGGRQVDWRGHGLQADTPPPSTPTTYGTPAKIVWPLEGTHSR